MTSCRSAIQAVWPYAFFVLYVVLVCFVAESIFEIVWIVIVLSFLGLKDYCRRSTLQKREDGMYVWVEWHGGERCSSDDPSADGGEWDSDGDGDGGD